MGVALGKRLDQKVGKTVGIFDKDTTGEVTAEALKWAREIEKGSGTVRAKEFLQEYTTAPESVINDVLGIVTQPSEGSIIEFKNFGSYLYVAVRVGNRWFLTQDGTRSSAQPSMTWNALQSWAGRDQFRRTMAVVREGR